MELTTAIKIVDKDYFDLTGEYQDQEVVIAQARDLIDEAELQQMAESGEDPEVLVAYQTVSQATDDEISEALALIRHCYL